MATSEESRLEDNDWINILKLIKKGKCTPFIGAGTCAGILPMGRDIAKRIQHVITTKALSVV